MDQLLEGGLDPEIEITKEVIKSQEETMEREEADQGLLDIEGDLLLPSTRLLVLDIMCLREITEISIKRRETSAKDTQALHPLIDDDMKGMSREVQSSGQGLPSETDSKY
jgi:hypothetical protein